ncbi:MAG: glycosyltransferase family protein [candidate division Zixibacteria bacterium]
MMEEKSSYGVLAILQARMSSSRLPGKVLRPIMGRPVLEYHIERLARSLKIDKLIVAASDQQDDTPICELCDNLGVEYYCGSLVDVLDRFYRASLEFPSDIIVRLTGDCPLADSNVIDQGIEYFAYSDFDYLSNTVERTFPIGLDFEIFHSHHLKKAWENAVLPSEREHVTPYFRNHPELFSIGQFTNDIDLSHHRWTVDEPQDFEFVLRVFESLYPDNPTFKTGDVLRLLEQNPHLMSINYDIIHGAGYEKSIREDKKYLEKQLIKS